MVQKILKAVFKMPCFVLRGRLPVPIIGVHQLKMVSWI